jgi:hypothetical protein
LISPSFHWGACNSCVHRNPSWKKPPSKLNFVCKSLVGLLGASNWVVELAPILYVKVSCRLQGHHLVERELAFVACSPENRVILCGVGGLFGTTPLQRRRTSRNKEGTTGIHPYVFVSPLQLLLSFTCTFTYIVIASLLVTLCKFT